MGVLPGFVEKMGSRWMGKWTKGGWVGGWKGGWWVDGRWMGDGPRVGEWMVGWMDKFQALSPAFT